MKKNPVCFHTNELTEDVGVKMLRNRYRTYPVLDANEQLVGYISRYHIMDAPKRKLILVDHNEFSQSVNAIEKSEVLEVIDHHRINDFSHFAAGGFPKRDRRLHRYDRSDNLPRKSDSDPDESGRSALRCGALRHNEFPLSDNDGSGYQHCKYPRRDRRP